MAAGSIPVWSSNRGTAMMVRVALSQSGNTPIFVNSYDELRRESQAPDVSCLVVSSDDIAQAALTPKSVLSLARPGVMLVFLVSGHAPVDLQGPAVRIVRVPFSAAELRKAIEPCDPGRREPVSGGIPNQPADITEIVKAEIDRIIREKAESMVAEAVMKIVPELAEVMIKAELARLLAEEGERAVSQDPPSQED